MYNKEEEGEGGRSSKRLRTYLKIRNFPLLDMVLTINMDAVDANHVRAAWYVIHAHQYVSKYCSASVESTSTVRLTAS